VTDGRILFSKPHKLWLSESGITDWLNSGRLDELNRTIAAHVRKSLQKSGAISRRDLRRLSPFGRSHTRLIALGAGRRFAPVGRYAIPVPSIDTSLTRAVAKMLAISSCLSIDEIHTGLRQTTRLEAPPIEVLLAELTNHPDFLVEGDSVRSAVLLDRESLLSASEKVAVAAIENAGGLLLWTELDDAVKQAGYSHALAAVILRQPFMVRRAIAIYGLRGRPTDQNLLQKKTRQRRAARRKEVIRARRLDADRIEVQFTLGTFALEGVLAIPGVVRRLHIARWRAVFPGGRERYLTARNGFIWNVAPWLQECDVRTGDVLIATFYVAEARIEFDEPISSSASQNE
jgi:hypothetical protein